MQDLNSVVEIGRLTHDPELKYLNSGSAVMNFSIAVNTSKKTESGYEDVANFFECTLFGKLAETLKPYMTKGKQVALVGHLGQQRWEKDGQKHSKVVINVDSIQLVGGKASGEDSSFTASDLKEENKSEEKPVPSCLPKFSALSGNTEEFTEDIPF